MNEKVNLILDFIAANHSNTSLTMEITGKELGMSEKEINFLLNSSLKITFSKYLMQTRLREMRRLLTQTQLPIGDVYRRVGLPDPVYYR